MCQLGQHTHTSKLSCCQASFPVVLVSLLPHNLFEVSYLTTNHAATSCPKWRQLCSVRFDFTSPEVAAVCVIQMEVWNGVVGGGDE